MDLYQLRYFLEVARELSFTRAAENLHISAPAVSRSISLLERSVGRRLFQRTKRKVSLTADGEFLKGRAQGIYDSLEAVSVEWRRARPGRPEMLRVGSREMITDYLLTGPLGAFRRSHPDTRFGLYELGPDEMADALKRDQIDFGFYYAGIADPALEVRHLGRLRSHIYGAKSVYGRRKRTFKALLQEPFVAPRYFRADPTAPSLDGFPDDRHPRRIQYCAEFMETHRRFVLDGLAVGVLPDLVVQDEWKRGRLVRFPGPVIHREIYMHTRKGRPLPESVDEFREAVRREIRRAAKTGR
jgi:DNA-binding transcriptional LysR family regulator